MDTSSPRFLKFARALALVGGSALAACSAPTMPGSDASSDRNAVTDSNACCDAAPADVAQLPDSSMMADASVDSAPDASPDAAGDAGADAAGDAPADAVADASTCPAVAPMDGTGCTMNAQVCMYTGAGGEFTQCTCTGGAWMCFTAVPGPLPPPELPA
ncbi:MAG: hypothetical protein U0269_25020 [Polyangiales bacterium]